MRKIWGTLKNTTISAVAKALKTFTNIPANSLTIKRKYKVTRTTRSKLCDGGLLSGGKGKLCSSYKLTGVQ